jgi:hypothetical protein
MNGNALFWRFGLNSNQYNIDTINLDDGCYLFELNDNGNDGLDFWWSNATTGTGSVKFQGVFPPVIFQYFNADFGSKIIHQFTVGGGVSSVQEKTQSLFQIFPNPTTGKLKIDIPSTEVVDAQIFTILGEAVWQEQLIEDTSQKELDLSHLPNGVYLIKLRLGETIHTKKIILNR